MHRSSSIYYSHRAIFALFLLGTGAAVLIPDPVQATPATNLGSIGQTQLQQDTGDAVQMVCGGFVAAGTTPGTVPLFDTCRSMVQTANDINNTGGGTGDSLMLTADELAAALQQVATEEFAATESMANEISTSQAGNVIGRLAEVRRNVRGFSVAGFNSPGSTLASNARPGTRGGAAGSDDTWDKLGVFITGSYGTGDRDATARADEFDFDTYGITAGADYRFRDDLILGVAVSYHDVDSDFNTTATVSGGGVDADGWGGFLYGTYYVDSFYVDGLVGFSQSDYDTTREILVPSNNPGIPAIINTAKASTDSDDYTVSLGAGHYQSQGAMTFGPFGRITYNQVDIDDYRETGAEASGLNLAVDGNKWKSLTTVIGAQFSYAKSYSFGVLSPQGRIGWVHEFENSSEDVTATYVDDPLQLELLAKTDNPDLNYFELGLGVSAVFQDGIQAFFNYDTLLGLSDVSDHLFTVGVRLEF